MGSKGSKLALPKPGTPLSTAMVEEDWAALSSGDSMPPSAAIKFLKALSKRCGIPWSERDARAILSDVAPGGVPLAKHQFMTFLFGATAEARAGGRLALTQSLQRQAPPSADDSPPPQRLERAPDPVDQVSDDPETSSEDSFFDQPAPLRKSVKRDQSLDPKPTGEKTPATETTTPTTTTPVDPPNEDSPVDDGADGDDDVGDDDSGDTSGSGSGSGSGSDSDSGNAKKGKGKGDVTGSGSDGSDSDSSYYDFSGGDEDDFACLMRSGTTSITPEDREYRILSATEVVKAPLAALKEVNEVLQISGTVARQLLMVCGWNKEKLLTKYYDPKQRKRLFKAAKIPKSFAKWKPPEGEVECPVCWDEGPASEMVGLPCNHFFCRACYEDYVEVKVKTEGKASSILCQATDCFLALDELTALSLVKDKKTKKLYKLLIAKDYVRDNHYMRFCSGNDCTRVVDVEVLKPQIIQCLCGYYYCFGCGEEEHSPATCEDIVTWKARVDDGDDGDSWIKLNSRPCPGKGCAVLITRRDEEEGPQCQFMTCSQCKSPFCWLCMKVLQRDHQRHDCNRYDPLAGNSEISKLAMEAGKYEHFSSRYLTHMNSLKSTIKGKEKIYAHLTSLLEQSILSWQQLKQVKEAYEGVMRSRRVLRDSYVYGYYLPAYVNRELFEFYQSDLEYYTEAVTGLLARKPWDMEEVERLKIMDELVNQNRVLTKSVDSFLDHLAKGKVKGGEGAAKVTWEPIKVATEYKGWVYGGS